MMTDNSHAVGMGRDDWLKAAGGLLFFVAGLLAWWELRSDSGFIVTDNAFDFLFTGVVPYAIFVGIAIVTVIIRTGSLRLPVVLVHPVLSLGAAGVGTVLVAIRFFVDGFPSVGDVTIERGIGLYLAALAALLVLAGCVLSYLAYRAEYVEDDDDDGSMATPEDQQTWPPSAPPLP